MNQCSNINDINTFIRVSDKPTFTGTTKSSATICLGQTNTLTGFANDTEIEYYCDDMISDTTAIPDGVGISYTSTITLDCFNPGATVLNANDIVGICLSIEHSYVRDMDITITCPNGTVVDLYIPQLTGVNSGHLGEPVDNDASGTFGDPMTYCFNQTAAKTWDNVLDPVPPPPLGTVPTHSYIDNDGTAVNNQYYIPAGNYKPTESFASLVGCPLNGDWTITITDNLSSDNGVLFNWSTEFNPSYYNSINDYTPYNY